MSTVSAAAVDASRVASRFLAALLASRDNRSKLVPLPPPKKNAQLLPSSLNFGESDDEDFEPWTVEGPLGDLHEGAQTERGSTLQTDSHKPLPKQSVDASIKTTRVPATTTRSGRTVFLPDRFGIVS
ncbi:hypothetical protein HPB50_009565 [Hyalomma asiaticum]|uniref:Uncharacterized protein n=1 Tax=Hyalomma asiaticum TaxID=266040 RepID=A0ACB7TFG5_HYAAI|nr:hypothetical protein HPB50_009565 [Hyalomma asiaticum]